MRLQEVSLFHEPPFVDTSVVAARLLVGEPLPRMRSPLSSPVAAFGVDSRNEQSKPPAATGGAEGGCVVGGLDDTLISVPEEAVLLSGTFFNLAQA